MNHPSLFLSFLNKGTFQNTLKSHLDSSWHIQPYAKAHYTNAYQTCSYISGNVAREYESLFPQAPMQTDVLYPGVKTENEYKKTKRRSRRESY